MKYRHLIDHTTFTPKEHEILRYLHSCNTQILPARQLASVFGIDKCTLECHYQNMYTKCSTFTPTHSKERLLYVTRHLFDETFTDEY